MNVGGSYSHFFIFLGCLALALKIIFSVLSGDPTQKIIFYGLMQSKLCYPNYGLKGIRESSTINLLHGQTVLPQHGS